MLATFEKTPLLAPGEEKVLSISFPTENMASIDEEKAAFVMEEGKYLVRVGEDSRINELFGVIAVSGEACFRQVRNEFRPDHGLALIEAPKREALLSSLSETCPLCGIVKDAVTDHVSDVTIFGADCVAIDNRCATREADDCNAKRFADVTDGPAGCHLPLNGATAYPTGIVMAQTWDPEAGRLMGEDLGRELVYFGVDRGVYLKRDDVRACAARVLEQIMDSVSFALISE